MWPGVVSPLKRCVFSGPDRFLDVATGTGDLSIGAAMKYPQIRVIGVDFVLEMIKAGKQKVERKRPFRKDHPYAG